MEHVTVNWTGPYSYEVLDDTKGHADDFGLYAFSRVFGDSETLLYIGLAYWQTLFQRIGQHNWIADVRGQIRVRMGVIVFDTGQKHSEKRLKDVEAALIYYNQPLHNTQHMSSYSGRKLQIINQGRFGLLEKTIDT